MYFDSIDGYKQSSSLGSKTSMNGVAIYFKNDLNVLDCNVWLEVKNDEHKYIVCGCLYRDTKCMVMTYQ